MLLMSMAVQSKKYTASAFKPTLSAPSSFACSTNKLASSPFSSLMFLSLFFLLLVPTVAGFCPTPVVPPQSSSLLVVIKRSRAGIGRISKRVQIAALPTGYKPQLTLLAHDRESSNDRRQGYSEEVRKDEEDCKQQEKAFTMKVTHENKTIALSISPNEPILQALERHDLQDKLSLHSLPQDCRRGNCLTCSGRMISGDRNRDIITHDDGLSPSMSNRISKKNIVLTCSSYVKNDGVHLELGVCDDAWREIWGSSEPWDDKEGERIRNDAVARAMRINDEKSLNRWIVKTEKMLLNADEAKDDF